MQVSEAVNHSPTWATSDWLCAMAEGDRDKAERIANVYVWANRTVGEIDKADEFVLRTQGKLQSDDALMTHYRQQRQRGYKPHEAAARARKASSFEVTG